MFNIENFEGKNYELKDEKQLDNILTEMYIINDKEASKHQVFTGMVRGPQEILPAQYEKQWKRGAPHTTIRAKKVDSIAQRNDINQFARAVIIGRKIKAEEFYFLKYTYHGKGSDSDKKNEWNEFQKAMYDFLDYIVPIISKSEDNNIKIDMVMYAEHTYPNNGIPEFYIVYRANDKDYLWLLFESYANYLKVKEEKGSDRNAEKS